MVSADEESCACAKVIKVLKKAREEINAVAHDADDNEGKRAIVEMAVLVYRVIEQKKIRGDPQYRCISLPDLVGGWKNFSSWCRSSNSRIGDVMLL
jgi:hypothetical protein